MSSDLAVVVLAGGEGSRIGGGKPLRRLGEQRLIDRALDVARLHSDLVAIAVRDAQQAGGTHVALLNDHEAEGPIGGLIAALEFAKASARPLLLTIPTDMPFLPPDLFDRLSREIGANACALAASGGRIHPVCGLWRAHALDKIGDYLATGRRSLRGLAELAGHVVVDWPGGEGDPFFNINSEADLAEAERRLAG